MIPFVHARHLLANSIKASSGQLSAQLHDLLGSRTKESFGILFYHRVTPQIKGLPEPMLNVTPERFREQLEGLLARGYQFWTLREVIEATERGTSIPEKTVVLTFDDGFANLYTYAFPIMKELNVPATIFVVTDYIGKNEPMHFDAWGCDYADVTPDVAWRSMNWEEIREMHDSGLIEIGAHTHTHRAMGATPAEFAEDLNTCIDILRNELGIEKPVFAFPFGDPTLGYVNDAMMNAVRRSDAICGLTTCTELVSADSDPYGWGRLEVVEHDSGATLAAKLEGWYNWMRRVRDLAHQVAPW